MLSVNVNVYFTYKTTKIDKNVMYDLIFKYEMYVL